MTEEDTFKALKKIPYEDIFAKATQQLQSWPAGARLEAFLNQYGWTTEEFNKENTRRSHQRIQEALSKATREIDVRRRYLQSS